MKRILIIVVLFTIHCNGQVLEEVALNAMKSESYTIASIDSTDNYYLFKGKVNGIEPVLLVVDKKSRQLKGKKIEVGNTYEFEAYRLYDIFAMNANMIHRVDNREIWRHSDKIDLRFTDGRGSEYFEEE